MASLTQIPVVGGEEFVKTVTASNEKFKELFVRLYRLLASLLDKKPAYLSDVNLAKIRFKVEKKFPVLVDLSQSSGFSTLCENANDIVVAFDPIVRVLREVSQHMAGVLALIKNSNLVAFDLTFNRPLLASWVELCSSYIRVIHLLQKIPEAVSIVILYYAAKVTLGSVKQANAGASDFAWLKASLQDPRQHLLAQFIPQQAMFQRLLPIMLPTLQFSLDIRKQQDCFDISNVDFELEGHHVAALGPLPPLQETRHARSFVDFILLSIVVCPGLLFDETYSNHALWVLQNVFIVSLFRDLTLNIHMELDTLFAGYSGEGEIIQVPRTVKISTFLKTISRQSIASVGKKQAIRRQWLVQYLEDVLCVVKSTPGAMPLKAKAALMACTALNTELLRYVQHYPPFETRKDTKQNVVAEEYSRGDLGACLRVLHDVTAALSASSSSVRNFYLQYVSEVQAKRIIALQEDCQMRQAVGELSLQLVWLVAQLQRPLEDLRALTLAANPNQPSNESLRENIASSVQVLRAMGQAALLGLSQLAPEKRSSSSLHHLLPQLLEDVQFLDHSVASLVDPYEIGWFRPVLKTCLEQSLVLSDAAAAASIMYFSPLESVMLNVHPLVMEEVMDIGKDAVVFANTLVQLLLDHVETLFKQSWSRRLFLEAQTQAPEACKRLDMMARAKQMGLDMPAGATFSLLPGYESEMWAEQEVREVVLPQHTLAYVLRAIKHKPVLRVFTREYHLVDLVQSRLSQMYIAKCGSMIVFQDRFLRFSEVYQKYEIGVQVFSWVLRLLEVHNMTEVLSDLRRQQVFGLGVSSSDAAGDTSRLGSEIGDALSQVSSTPFATSFTPVGLPMPLDYVPPGQTLVAQLCDWLEKIVMRVAAPGSSLIYAPHLQTFVELNAQNEIGEAPESYLTMTELRCLAKLVGLYGLRVLEARLLTIVSAQLSDVAAYLHKHRAMLEALEQDYCFSLSSAQAMEPMEQFVQNLKSIGAALVVRKLLMQAAQDIFAVSCPDLEGIMSLWHDNMPHATMDLTGMHARVSLYSLFHTCGLTETEDFSLFESLITMQLSGDELNALQHLPMAAAAVFGHKVADKWRYNARIGGFVGNEHLIPVALVSLLLFVVNVTLHMKQELPNVTLPDLLGESPLDELHRATQLRARFLMQYLQYGSQCILTRRTRDTAAIMPHIPYGEFSQLLRHFVEHGAPLVTYNQLEQFMAYDWLHHACLDSSLGKHVAADPISAFQSTHIGRAGALEDIATVL